MKLPTFLCLLTLSSLATAQQGRPQRADKAPKLGAAIPKVRAHSPDGKKSIALAEPKRLTILIFGSHT